MCRLTLEAMLIVGAVEAYRFVRTITEGSHDAAFRNGRAVLRLEQTLGIDVERRAQSVVLGSRLLVDVFNTIYVWGYWPAVLASLLLLFVVDRRRFRCLRNALFLSGSMGLVVFAVFPVAPPRMVTGFVDTVQLYAHASVAHPGGFTNEYAAMPSFHVGWLVLSGVAVMPIVPRRVLWPLMLLPAGVMSVTVVVTANHYLVDAVAGSAVALSGLVVAQRLPRLDVLWEMIQRHLEPSGGVRGAMTKARLNLGAGLVPFVGARAAYVAQATDRPARAADDARRSSRLRAAETSNRDTRESAAA